MKSNPTNSTAKLRQVISSCFGWAWLLALLLGTTACPAQTGSQREYEFKTGILYHVLKYVDWPGGTSSNSPPTLQICLLGDLAHVEALEVLEGKTIHGRKLLVKRVTEANEPGCDVLFIGASEKGRLEEIITSLKARPTLTVSEVDGFAERGGMVNMVLIGKRVALEVNRQAANQAGLRFSSQLLRLAKIFPR